MYSNEAWIFIYHITHAWAPCYLCIQTRHVSNITSRMREPPVIYVFKRGMFHISHHACVSRLLFMYSNEACFIYHITHVWAACYLCIQTRHVSYITSRMREPPVIYGFKRGMFQISHHACVSRLLFMYSNEACFIYHITLAWRCSIYLCFLLYFVGRLCEQYVHSSSVHFHIFNI
jgi:hypothetical protein